MKKIRIVLTLAAALLALPSCEKSPAAAQAVPNSKYKVVLFWGRDSWCAFYTNDYYVHGGGVSFNTLDGKEHFISGMFAVHQR